MVSEAYKRLEDKIGTTSTLYDDLIESIIYKSKKDRQPLERALYLTCVTTGSPPIEAAHIINEFLVHVSEQENTKEA